MATGPTDLDWVRARADAPLFTTFRRLVAGVKKDVATRACLRRTGDAFTLDVVESADQCVVTRRGSGRSAQVRFAKYEHGIEAVGEELRLRATLSLDGDGQCRLHVNGVPTEEWHFRQLALQALFFDTPNLPRAEPLRATATAAPLTRLPVWPTVAP
jgi:hypothetical protein